MSMNDQTVIIQFVKIIQILCLLAYILIVIIKNILKNVLTGFSNYPKETVHGAILLHEFPVQFPNVTRRFQRVITMHRVKEKFHIISHAMKRLAPNIRKGERLSFGRFRHIFVRERFIASACYSADRGNLSNFSKITLDVIVLWKDFYRSLIIIVVHLQVNYVIRSTVLCRISTLTNLLLNEKCK